MLRQTSLEYNASIDRLSMIFMALADPTRRRILEMLSKGDATVNELARPFSVTLPAISKHLKVLERAGLISRGRNAQWRPCRLEAEVLKEGADWMDQYRQLWEESLSNLESYVQKLQAQERTGKGDEQ
jgi:DNA-binding transcriptional ArsR family regulator